jgi:Family of unknown function (DUF6675)
MGRAAQAAGFAMAVLALASLRPALAAPTGPLAPCPAAADPRPAYGPVDGVPNVAWWRDLEVPDTGGCLGEMRGHMELVVALAGRFHAAGTLEDMARRMGAVSQTPGLRYWSVNDGAWRTLLTEAFALSEPDGERRRADFSAAEMLRGRALYTAQRDTRSTGLNVYQLRARRVGARRLIVESRNLTPIRLLVFELFEPGALRVIHILDRLEPDLWRYYAITAVRSGALESDPRSMINRSAAFYRFLRSVPGDRDPPLAP